MTNRNPRGGKNGDTPLHLAVYWNRIEAIKYLTSKLDDISVKNYEGKTPIHNAARNGSIQVLQILAPKVTNMNIQDDYGFTPLHYAIYWRDRKSVV